MAHVASALLRASSVHGGEAELYSWDASGSVRFATARSLRRGAFGLAEALRLRGVACVAIHVRDGIAFTEAFYASVAAGCIAAPLHVRWSHEECAVAASVVGADVLITDDVDVAIALAKRSTSLRWILLHASSKDELEQVRSSACRAEVSRTCDAALRRATNKLFYAPCGTAFVCFTSGTTGPFKAARISHASALYQASQKRKTMVLDGGSCVLHALPWAHVGALSQLHASMWSTCKTHVFLDRFEARTCRDAMLEHRITHLSLVPPMLDDLRHVDGRAWTHVSSLLVGGGALDARRRRDANAMFPNASIATAYGATEAFSTIAVGVVEGGYEAVSDTWALECKRHRRLAHTPNAWCGCEAGEVLVRGPHVMLGYHNDEAATKSARTETGWWRSGDLGTFLDEKGTRFQIVGRIKDVIRTGGEGVHARQVEQILEQHPSVRRAAVFGIPHAYYGEMVTAAVELQPHREWQGSQLWHAKADTQSAAVPTINKQASSGEQMQAFCRDQGLSGFKLPRIVWCREGGLPVNSLGKVVKSKLQQELQQAQEGSERLGDAEVGQLRLLLQSKL